VLNTTRNKCKLPEECWILFHCFSFCRSST
jgi:hypothetical protein